MHIYIRMCICMYTYKNIFIYMFEHTATILFIYMYIYTYMYTHIYINVYISMYVNHKIRKQNCLTTTNNKFYVLS